MNAFMRNLKNKYSIGEKILLGFWLLRTKLICKSVRLFRFPLIIRGGEFIDYGEGLTTGVGCRFDCFSRGDSSAKRLIFGKNVQINDYVHIVAMDSVKIGDDVLMASHVFISDNSHGSYKGDNNDTPDSWLVKEADVVGQYKMRIRWIGWPTVKLNEWLLGGE